MNPNPYQFRCPKCGKYLRNTYAYFDEDKNIKRVLGYCHSHKQIEPKNWVYEDFFPPPNLKDVL